MSVIVRDEDGQIFLFCKGADRLGSQLLFNYFVNCIMYCDYCLQSAFICCSVLIFYPMKDYVVSSVSFRLLLSVKCLFGVSFRLNIYF